MSTEKTLATVKPGGCVQLGGGLVPRYRHKFNEWWSSQPCDISRLTTYELALTAYQGGFTAGYLGSRAALSAQPSPGGQDALASELLAHAEGLERMAADDRETGLSIEQAIEDGEGYTPDEATDVAAGLQHDAERGEETAALLRKAVAALAARQPEVK